MVVQLELSVAGRTPGFRAAAGSASGRAHPAAGAAAAVPEERGAFTLHLQHSGPPGRVRPDRGVRRLVSRALRGPGLLCQDLPGNTRVRVDRMQLPVPAAPPLGLGARSERGDGSSGAPAFLDLDGLVLVGTRIRRSAGLANPGAGAPAVPLSLGVSPGWAGSERG